MRISVLGFARIQDKQGRYALLVNKGRLTRGTGRDLSPIGGSLEYTAGGRRFLEGLGATDFEGDKAARPNSDLLFRVPDSGVQSVIAWFDRRQQRELTVLRELREELAAETGLLRMGNLSDATEQLTGVFRYHAVTIRDVPEKQTAYLIEVFDVTLNPCAMRILLTAARVPVERRWVYFVTAGEMADGRTRDGVTIGPISRFVL